MKKLESLKKLETLDKGKFKKLELSNLQQLKGGITLYRTNTYVAVGGDTYDGCDNGCSGGHYTY